MTIKKPEKLAFDGSGPKSLVKQKRDVAAGALGSGAQQLAEFEKKLQAFKKEHEEVDKIYHDLEAAYAYMKSDDGYVVSLKEFQYVSVQRKGFKERHDALEKSIKEAEAAVKAEKERIEALRSNVIYLDEILRTEGELVDLDGYRRQRLAGQNSE